MWLIIRRLRANSPPRLGTIFSRRPCPRDIDGPQAPLDHVEGQRQVVAHDRVDDHVGVLAGGVDRAVAGRDRGEPGLPAADRHLVAPVDALLVAAVAARGALDEADLAAGVADAGGPRRPPPAPPRRGLPQRVGVGEGQHRPAGALDGRVLGADLAAPRQLEDEVGAGLARRAAVPSEQPSQATITSSSSRG